MRARADALFVAASAFAVAARYGSEGCYVERIGGEMGLSLGKWCKERIPWTSDVRGQCLSPRELAFGLFVGTAQITYREALSSRLADLFKYIPYLNVPLVVRLECMDSRVLGNCAGDVLVCGLLALGLRPTAYRELASDSSCPSYGNAAKAAEARTALECAAKSGSESAAAFASTLAELDTMQRELAGNLSAVSTVADELFSNDMRLRTGPLESPDHRLYTAAREQRKQVLEKIREMSKPHDLLKAFTYTVRHGECPADSGLVCTADAPSATDVPVVPKSFDHLMALAKIALTMDVFDRCCARTAAAGRSAAATAAACANLAWVAASLD